MAENFEITPRKLVSIFHCYVMEYVSNMNMNCLSVKEMKDGSVMNGDKMEKIRVIRKERCRIVRGIRHGRGMEKEGGNGG